MPENEIYERALALWGFDAQIKMVIEEALEFALEVQRLHRNRTKFNKLIEEIVDVEIMIAQLKYIIKIPTYKIENEKLKKLRRLKRLIRIGERNDVNDG
jgi:NTP pyrophosphatase (non-canonical NTP hydrolase)